MARTDENQINNNNESFIADEPTTEELLNEGFIADEPTTEELLEEKVDENHFSKLLCDGHQYRFQNPNELDADASTIKIEEKENGKKKYFYYGVEVNDIEGVNDIEKKEEKKENGKKLIVVHLKSQKDLDEILKNREELLQKREKEVNAEAIAEKTQPQKEPSTFIKNLKADMLEDKKKKVGPIARAFLAAGHFISNGCNALTEKAKEKGKAVQALAGVVSLVGKAVSIVPYALGAFVGVLHKVCAKLVKKIKDSWDNTKYKFSTWKADQDSKREKRKAEAKRKKEQAKAEAKQKKEQAKAEAKQKKEQAKQKKAKAKADAKLKKARKLINALKKLGININIKPSAEPDNGATPADELSNLKRKVEETENQKQQAIKNLNEATTELDNAAKPLEQLNIGTSEEGNPLDEFRKLKEDCEKTNAFWQINKELEKDKKMIKFAEKAAKVFSNKEKRLTSEDFDKIIKDTKSLTDFNNETLASQYANIKKLAKSYIAASKKQKRKLPPERIKEINNRLDNQRKHISFNELGPSQHQKTNQVPPSTNPSTQKII